MRAELAASRHVLERAEQSVPLAYALGIDLDLRVSARRLRVAMDLFGQPWRTQRHDRRLTG